MPKQVKQAKSRNPKRPRQVSITDTPNQDLDAILSTRWGGAVNIRGIRYQILYSLLCAFDIYNQEGSNVFLRLEGIEDIDLIGFHYQNEYIQVKSADSSWNWSKLKEPLKGFLPVHRNNDNCIFVLAVGFPLNNDIQKLSQLETLNSTESKRIRNAFHNLCYQVGYSEVESKSLLQKFKIISVSEEKIWQELVIIVMEKFQLGSEAVETYILALVAKFLEWAKDRKHITRLDLEMIRNSIGESLSRETEFQAYGQGLINRVEWLIDSTPTDFFAGKGTRAGHIVAGLDIARPVWIDRIDIALNTSKVCILRSSSGQGKSTLLYRYAYEKRTPKNIFTLRIAETPEQVELIRNYLQHLAKLGLPVLLIIDDVKWQTRLWAAVAQQCAALDIRVLVTIRDEDWQRFTQESLISYEILEPSLDIEEARQIFEQIKVQGKIHLSVTSPDWAYEKIDKPYLLLEYIYLVTQGEMLEERLRYQIKQIHQQQEDPSKIEILRRVTFAHSLGVPLLLEKLFQKISFKSDPQQVLQSMIGEYLYLENGLLTGVHWVRSNLLAQILHEDFPNPASTALSILEAVPKEYLTTFISKTIIRKNTYVDVFLTGLVDTAQKNDLRKIIDFLDGIFEAGEYFFLEANKEMFDESYYSLGSCVPTFLGISLTPLHNEGKMPDFVYDLAEKSEGFNDLVNIHNKIIKVDRGLDLCSFFLNGIIKDISPEKFQVDFGYIGVFLDWCFVCNIQIPSWNKIKDLIYSYEQIFQLPFESFCKFSQGLYRYDEGTYKEWFSKHQKYIVSYVKLHIDCIKLELVDNAVYIEFFPGEVEPLCAHEETINRLDYLRSSIPSCDFYKSQGIWILPLGLEPSIDETHKNIEKKYLPFKSDGSKNNKWLDVVNKKYLPDSCYKYQESWYSIRKNLLLLIESFVKILKKGFSGRKIESEISELCDLIVKADNVLRYAPLVSKDDLKFIIKNSSSLLIEIYKHDSLRNWWQGINNFIQQLNSYLKGRDSHTGKLMLYNFNEAKQNLPEVQKAFNQLFKESPDYFNAIQLESQEIISYEILSNLLEIWISEEVSFYSDDILQYIQKSKELKQQNTIHALQKAIMPLKESGIDFIIPNGIYIDYPARYLPIAFSINDPCHPENELCLIINAISEIQEITDYFCLIPIYQSKKIIDGAYYISSTQIPNLLNNEIECWETLIPRPLLQGAWNCLPEIEFSPNLNQWLSNTINGLIVDLEIIYRRKIIIESVESDQNCFEIESHKRNLAKLGELVQRLVSSIEQNKTKLEADFLGEERTPEYARVLACLDLAVSELQENNLDEAHGRILEGIEASYN
jgi:hypothetical protein